LKKTWKHTFALDANANGISFIFLGEKNRGENTIHYCGRLHFAFVCHRLHFTSESEGRRRRRTRLIIVIVAAVAVISGNK